MKAIIAGGGTGGHVFPAIALGRELVKRWGPDSVLFVGTPNGLEMELVPKHGFTIETLPVLPLKRVSIMRRLKSLCLLPLSYFRCRKIIGTFQPDVVIGVGGYAAGPMVLTAWSWPIPTVILEQNSIPGFTNKILSRFVKRIFTGLPTRSFPKHKVKLVGNPVRDEVIKAREVTFPSNDSFHVLIYGGSQGAKAINEVMIEAAPLIKDIQNLSIVHQTGPTLFDECQAAYKRAGIKHSVVTFIDAMHEEYAKAHLVIARSGAMTISELAIVGRPTILIPFPFAADNHQVFNAQYLAGSKGAIIIEQKDLTADKIAKQLHILANDYDKLQKMAQQVSQLGQIHAAETIAKHIESLLAKRLGEPHAA